MNARMTKEIRVLLPAFGIALSAALLPFLASPHEPEALAALLFVFGCTMMGALIFGNEFQHRTLSLLLTQPIPRTSLWKEKMRVLATALAIAAGVLCATLLLFDSRVRAEVELLWILCGFVPLFCVHGRLLIGEERMRL